MAEWLQNVKDLRASSSKEPAATVQADDALQIMTIHNSKGLEFDLVILPQLDKSVKGDTASIKYLPGKEGEQGLLGIKVPDKELQLQKAVFMSWRASVTRCWRKQKAGVCFMLL